MRMMMLLLMVFIVPAGNAQQVFKCVKGKDISYQSAPCDETQKVARQWDAPPDPAPTAEEVRERQLKNQHDRTESAQLSRVAGTLRTGAMRGSRSPRNSQSSSSRCDAAKARREVKLKSVGLKRTFALLRKLDDEVYEACKQA